LYLCVSLVLAQRRERFFLREDNSLLSDVQNNIAIVAVATCEAILVMNDFA
jgi:hypothetical protein